MSRQSGKMDKKPAKTKPEIAKKASSPQRVVTQDEGGVPLNKPTPKVALTKGSPPAWPVTSPSRPSQRRGGKKILLLVMVAASICVVAAWAVFTAKPSWFAQVKGRLPLIGTPTNKRSAARYPSRPVFKVVQPQRTNPLPPSTPPMMAEQMQRPQTSPSGISPAAPPTAYPVTRPQVSTPGGPQVSTPGGPQIPTPGAAGIPPSAPPTAYPVTRPQVSTPGTAGIPPAVPPSLAKGPPPATYPGARPEVGVPGAPGIAPTLPPSSPSAFPGEVERPQAGTSSGQGATSGFSSGKKEEGESDEYLEIATLYAQKGKYQKAEELFQKVAKENPSSAKVHNNLGVVRLKQEKYDMAEREFKEAIRLEPAFVLPYYNLSCLYTKKGVSVEALIYLKKALKRDERVKQWVKTDKDFDKLRSDVVFQELMGGSSGKKEGAKKTTEVTPKNEVSQKPDKVQSQKGVPRKEGPLKKEETSKQAMPKQEMPPKTDVQKKKEEIPPQAGPLQPVPPKQKEIQKQEAPQGSTQQGAQGAPGAQGGGAAQ